jgi:hypothetical protein
LAWQEKLTRPGRGGKTRAHAWGLGSKKDIVFAGLLRDAAACVHGSWSLGAGTAAAAWRKWVPLVIIEGIGFGAGKEQETAYDGEKTEEGELGGAPPPRPCDHHRHRQIWKRQK